MTQTLYPHQRTGVAWLRERKYALLADEQRLGKTITSLVAARGLKKILVVCPTVVLWNWKAEAEKWVLCGEDVEVQSLIYEGEVKPPPASASFVKFRSPKVQIIAKGKTDLDPDADVVVVTHGLLLNPWILSQLAAEFWDALIVDEAHAFKSVGAKRTGALYVTLAKSADRVWLLTATPCPNNVGELYTHLRGLSPDRVRSSKDRKPMSYDTFIERFCLWRWTEYGRKITGNRKDRLPELKKRIDGFILRRRFSEVWPDIPRRRLETFHLRPLKLDKALEALNAELSPRILKAVRDKEDPRDLLTIIKDSAELGRFRRLCGMAKAKPVAELLSQELIDGGLKKVVIFAHHKDVIETLATELSAFGVRTITGATSAENRAAYVHEFQNDPAVRVMVCNIIAGGVGITLNAASEVVFVEQAWVPGDNDQASKRCDHKDQTHRVRVRFTALAGTCDEAITASNRQKVKMVQEVLGD